MFKSIIILGLIFCVQNLFAIDTFEVQLKSVDAYRSFSPIKNSSKVEFIGDIEKLDAFVKIYGTGTLSRASRPTKNKNDNRYESHLDNTLTLNQSSKIELIQENGKTFVYYTGAFTFFIDQPPKRNKKFSLVAPKIPYEFKGEIQFLNGSSYAFCKGGSQCQFALTQAGRQAYESTIVQVNNQYNLELQKNITQFFKENDLEDTWSVVEGSFWMDSTFSNWESSLFQKADNGQILFKKPDLYLIISGQVEENSWDDY